MRNAITTISLILSGAAILIFIIALVKPVLEGFPLFPSNNQTDNANTIPSQQHSPKPIEHPDNLAESIKDQRQPSPDKQESMLEQHLGSEINPSSEFNNPGTPPSPATQKPPSKTIAGNSFAQRPLAPSPPAAKTSSADRKTTADTSGKKKKRLNKRTSLPILVLGDSVFPPGQVSPNPEAQKLIAKIIPTIKAQPDDKVLVEGHVDSQLPVRVSRSQAAKLNQVISFIRAEEVAKLLMRKGISAGRIVIKGRADSVPIASNRTRQGRAKNRRVEVSLVPS